MTTRFDFDRRHCLKVMAACATSALAGAFARGAHAQADATTFTLRAAPHRVSLLGKPYPDTDVWAYNGRVPGPELRVVQGGELRVQVTNALREATTVHWHGLRIPNRMDGVPHVTQEPIEPGGRFDYAFTCPDAGTFWYHPHSRGHVQVDMGLHGALIVEEPKPPPVDRDVLWVLDDWRMLRDGQVSGDFGSLFDATHAGRIGNTVTINGALPDRFEVDAGERVRLRLLNVSNARIFALQFEGHAPYVVALDGMPCEPHAPNRNRIVLGPGMRADVILDAVSEPGASHRVIDAFEPRQAYEVVTIAYRKDRRRRARALDSRITLPANPVRDPDVPNARRHTITFTGGMGGMGGGMMGGGTMGGGMMGGGTMGGGMMGGGMMGGGMMGGGMMGGGMMGGAGGHAWAINGRSSTEDHHEHDPLLTLEHDRSHLLELRNDTMWWHPIHLHGHSFRLLSRNGSKLELRPMIDTMLLPPRETAEIAFVADNPGDWMFHCHVLEHQASGMMATIRVA